MNRTHKYRSGARSPGRKNRKLRAQGFQLPMRTAVGIVILACAGIFYLLLCTRTEALGRQIRQEEDDLAQLRRRVASEELRWNDMVGPRSLQATLRRHNLNMNWPRPDQVVHIRELPLWIAGGGHRELYTLVDNSQDGRIRIQ